MESTNCSPILLVQTMVESFFIYTLRKVGLIAFTTFLKCLQSMSELFDKLPYEIQLFIFDCLPLTFVLPFLQIEKYYSLVLDRFPKDRLHISLTNFKFEYSQSILGIGSEKRTFPKDTIFFDSSSCQILAQWCTGNKLPKIKQIVLHVQCIHQERNHLLFKIEERLNSLQIFVESIKLELLDINSSIELPYQKYGPLINILSGRQENKWFEHISELTDFQISRDSIQYRVNNELDVDFLLREIFRLMEWLWDSNYHMETSLTDLSIETNRISKSQLKDYEYIFQDFANIRSLSLEIYVPWNVINNYKVLKILNLNKIDFEGTHFIDLPVLETLVIRNSFIEKFDAVTLHSLKSLTIENCSSFTCLFNLHPKIENLNLKGNKNLRTNMLFEKGKVYTRLKSLSIGPSKEFVSLNLKKYTPSLERLDAKLKTGKLEIDSYSKTLLHLILESPKIGEVAADFDNIDSLQTLCLTEGLVRAERFYLPPALKTLKMIGLKISGRLNFCNPNVALENLWIEKCNFLSNDPESPTFMVPPNWLLQSLTIKSSKNIQILNLLKDLHNLFLFIYISEDNKGVLKKELSNCWQVFNGHYNEKTTAKSYGILKVDFKKHALLFREKFGLSNNHIPFVYYVVI